MSVEHDATFQGVDPVARVLEVTTTGNLLLLDIRQLEAWHDVPAGLLGGLTLPPDEARRLRDLLNANYPTPGDGR